MPSLDLKQNGADFILTRMDDHQVKSSIILSEMDVLTLAQSTLRLKDQILAKHNRAEAGVSLSLATPVAQVWLNVDLHQSEILLGMIDRHGAEVTFSLAPEVAKPLAERLPERLKEIEAAKKTRQ